VHLAHFAILGEVHERDDRAKLAAIGGTLGGGSIVEDLWLQHQKSGVWLDGPSSGVIIRNLRILDNSADGINLRRGIRDARIENVLVRNSGDDGIALWSHFAADAQVDIAHNTVVAPILANGIAIYGGRDIRVSDNLVADTLTQGGGIHIGNRFDAVPLAGTICIIDNLLVRTGSFDPNWKFGVGALWFYALDRPITADIHASGSALMDSTLSAIQFIGKPIRSVQMTRTTISRASTWLQLQSAGKATVSDLDATGLDEPSIQRCHAAFTLRTSAVPVNLTRSSKRLCGQLGPDYLARRLKR